jgi:hypothetical protein
MYKLRFFRWSIVACALMLVGGVILLITTLFPQVQQLRVVPLHYNIHIGVDKVGSWWQLFVPSLIGVVLTLINICYAVRIWSREKVIAYAVIVTALLLNILIAVHLIFIVILNLTYYA